MTQTMPTATDAARRADASRLLRLVLRVDSVSTAVMAVVLIAAVGPLGDATGMSAGFTVGFGIYQLGGAAALALIAGYPAIPPALARAVIAVNLLSGAACLVVAFADLMALTGFGVVFMVIGALVVTVYAVLEYVGLRRLTDAG
ncbi:hypothetical protein [Streptomyces sp. NPDC127033]|uniref:hypothetical protein n=1 Tax=Streptomyces sp. NPDC127033 TaxID=3347110 RepID=UPI00364B74D8